MWSQTLPAPAWNKMPDFLGGFLRKHNQTIFVLTLECTCHHDYAESYSCKVNSHIASLCSFTGQSTNRFARCSLIVLQPRRRSLEITPEIGGKMFYPLRFALIAFMRK